MQRPVIEWLSQRKHARAVGSLRVVMEGNRILEAPQLRAHIGIETSPAGRDTSARRFMNAGVSLVPNR